MEIDISIAERYEKENLWESALAEYKKLQEQYPASLIVAAKVGWCQSRLQLYDEAIETYKRISEKEPKKAEWQYKIGYQYYSKKEWNAAIDCFKNALKLYPNYFVVKYRLGYALTQCIGKINRLKSPEYLEAYKQFDECESLWENMPEGKRVREKSCYADVCFQKGKILIERRDWDNAIKALEKAVGIKKDE